MDTILAVDDESVNLEMVEYALGHDYEVVAVKDGATALRYLTDNVPSLILLDIRMPQMDGFEVYRQIKAQERLREVPVIFLTAAHDVETEDNCFEMGAVDFIAKPFEPKIVLRRVRRTLELLHRAGGSGYVPDKSGHADDSDRTVTVAVNGIDVRIFQKDIYYIEVFNNTCIIRTTNREYSVRETLDHLQQQLDDYFIRTGRSYLVNVRYIAELVDDIVIMENGMRIRLPRRNKKELQRNILDILTIHHKK